MSKPRKIVVDNVEYTWQCGGNYLKVRKDGKALFVAPMTEIKNCSWDDLERADWKKYGDGSIRSLWPREVAAEIRKRVKT